MWIGSWWMRKGAARVLARELSMKRDLREVAGGRAARDRQSMRREQDWGVTRRHAKGGRKATPVHRVNVHHSPAHLLAALKAVGRLLARNRTSACAYVP